MNKHTLQQFVNDFFSIFGEFNKIFLNSREEYGLADYIQFLQGRRDELIDDYSINTSDFDTQEMIANILINKNALGTHDKKANLIFSRTFLLGLPYLEQLDQEKILKCVSDYAKTNDINELYKFGHIAEDPLKEKTTLNIKDIIDYWSKVEKATAAGAVVNFIEGYAKSEDGKKFIEKSESFFNFSNTPYIWFKDLVDRIHKASPSGVSFILDDEQKSAIVKPKQSSIIEFHYLIPSSEEGIIYSNQLVATMSTNQKIFQSSYLMEATIANIVTTYYLNQYAKHIIEQKTEEKPEQYNESVKKDFIDNMFSNINWKSNDCIEKSKNDNMTLYNKNLQNFVLNAINYKQENPFGDFYEASKAIRNNSIVYLRKILDITESTQITQAHIEELEKDDGKNIFLKQTQFSNFMVD